MFTGIIQTVGSVTSTERRGGDLRVTIVAEGIPWAEVALGDSIASNGVCLTAVSLSERGFCADVSIETLDLTTVGQWKAGMAINLELALTPQSRLGGHIVSGHIDGIGEVMSRQPDARSERFQIRAPRQLAKYIAHKGSITVDGTSLTVNEVNGDVFDLNIVPHTIENTVIGDYTVGTKVNLEIDVIARYLERLLLGDKAADPTPSEGISEAFLAQQGYMK